MRSVLFRMAGAAALALILPTAVETAGEDVGPGPLTKDELEEV